MIASHRRRINYRGNQVIDVCLVDDIAQVEAERILVLGRVHLGVVEGEFALSFLSSDRGKRTLAGVRSQRDGAAYRKRAWALSRLAFSLRFSFPFRCWRLLLPVTFSGCLFLIFSLLLCRGGVHEAHQVVVYKDLAFRVPRSPLLVLVVELSRLRVIRPVCIESFQLEAIAEREPDCLR